MTPKGKLIAIGGNEDKGSSQNIRYKVYTDFAFFHLGILKIIIDQLKGTSSLIEVITTASRIPEEVGENYLEAFGRLGCTNIKLMHIKVPEDAHADEYLERLRKADGVLLTGGNQLRLCKIIKDTPVHEILMQRYMEEENFIIAGTSAGAVAMSKTMIYGGSSAEALLKGNIKIAEGLGFNDKIILDSHFVKRGRFGRLTQAIADQPDQIGIGLGEDTGVLITDGNHMETIGSGLVLIFDGHDLRHNSVNEIEKGEPISIEHMIVHVLARKYAYYIKERKFVHEGSSLIVYPTMEK